MMYQVKIEILKDPRNENKNNKNRKSRFSNYHSGRIITVVLEYYSKRKRDNIKSCVVVFFFDHKNFSFYYRTEAIERRNKRISIDTIKYLLKEGFNLPIY